MCVESRLGEGSVNGPWNPAMPLSSSATIRASRVTQLQRSSSDVLSVVNRVVQVWIVCGSLVGLAHPVWSQTPPSFQLSPPDPASLPSGPLGQSIQYGQRIVSDTQTVAKAYVGNGLTCSNCHLNGGRTPYAAPFVGLTGLFPQYRARSGSVESLEDRLNDCFLRSMNGKALPLRSPEMIGLLAYIAWLSTGVPVGTEVSGRGFRDITVSGSPDPVRGKSIYASQCAACHGIDGAGIKTQPNTYAFPPLWGAQSFNVGAGMARVSVAAAFIRAKMPPTSAGTLTNQDAFDVAAYVTSRPRPSFPATKTDWPKGGRPSDAR